MTLRIALVGAGHMGANHARVLGQLDDCELVAIAEQDPAAGARVARRAKVPLYRDVEELLRRERPDGVAVAVPTGLHRFVTEACLAAGAHVLVEKPIALRSEDAVAMIEAARVAGRQLRVGHTERFNPAVQALRERLKKGQAGRVLQIVTRRMSPYQPHVKDHGVVLDLGTHDLDVMRFLLDAEPVRVFAMSRRHIHTEFDDLMIGLVEFEGGTVGLLETNWLTPTKVRDLEILGQRGLFVINYLPQELFFYENAIVPSSWDGPGDFLLGVGEGPLVRYPLERTEPLRAEWEAFVAAVEGREDRATTGEDALQTLLLAEALTESARTGKPVLIATADVT
jgi:predicted dehydrogenase